MEFIFHLSFHALNHSLYGLSGFSDTNTTFIQVRVDIDQCGRIISEFIRKHFCSDEYTTISEDLDNNKLIIGFGYKIDGYPREMGHLHYKLDLALDLCVVDIKHFAKNRFIDHLETTDVVYRVMIG